ncbi:ParB/RepB/Spo0J family partition protein [Roseovarius sp. 217]|uniref:ParB/RepB/Spo0J family partition protein n=1 Tax=Roseovarius sp. (strain 217) TaxID=314264 RepID=UPI0012EE98DA|nr:ParB/RepB/Spo0J family partition protein [Roseovarius sp. 217]
MPDWVKELTIALKNTGRLDPILLWASPEGPEAPLVILDGRHRIAAYRSEGVSRNIPATVITCPWREALLISARSHSKAQYPLTANERADFAWRLVRESGLAYSKSEIAKATATSARTVARMRARLGDAQRRGDEGKFTGSWWRDRDDRVETEMEDDMTEDQRRAYIEEGTKEIRNLLDRRGKSGWRSEISIVDECLIKALGVSRIRAVAEYTFPSTEDADEWFSTVTADSPDIDPHDDPMPDF